MKWKLSHQDQWTETEMTDSAVQRMLSARGLLGLGLVVIVADQEAIETSPLKVMPAPEEPINDAGQ